MKPRLLSATAMALALPALPAAASEDLLTERCGACHSAEDAGFTRISGQRKTPEGWLMTIVRMRLLHEADVSLAEQAELVTYLSSIQGLAPSEAAPFRAALERSPSYFEGEMEHDLNTMCGRCHTTARFGLHRLTPEEWDLNVEMHMGLHPSIEYQAGARDRDWYEIAKTEIVPYLAETYRFDAAAWDEWLAAEKLVPDGDWVVLTEIPGKGQVYGRLTVTGTESPYQVSGTYVTESGEELPVSGPMNFYSGYEWRANLAVGGDVLRQVLAIDPDSGQLNGRQFVATQDSLGGPLVAAKVGSGPAVLGTVPEAAPAGRVTAQIVGTDLAEAEALAANAFGLTGSLEGSSGPVEIALGDVTAEVMFYDSIDSIRVEPDFAIARVGGGGEEVPPPVPAHFKAIGFWNGADGEAGTEDDIRIGALPATWSVENEGEIAEAMDDAAFAGTMDSGTGIFTPAIAGPNPDRPFSTNNAGELAVLAEAAGLTGEAKMIVTVQRFVDPPIR